MEVTHGYVYSIQYHIVCCVKYRHKIILTKVEKRLVEILNKIADDNEIQILECNTEEQIRQNFQNQKRKREVSGKSI